MRKENQANASDGARNPGHGEIVETAISIAWKIL